MSDSRELTQHFTEGTISNCNRIDLYRGFLFLLFAFYFISTYHFILLIILLYFYLFYFYFTLLSLSLILLSLAAMKKILILGDGNFSFALALAQLLLPTPKKDTDRQPKKDTDENRKDALAAAHRYLNWPFLDAEPLEIYATSFDLFDDVIEKYPESKFILARLHRVPAVQVLHGINAWELARHFDVCRFDVILWNHPHLGTEV